MSCQTPQLKINLIKAGAGTGKTTTLIKTLIDSILQYHTEHNKFPKVAVSTFTRKATRELKERIIIKALESKNTEFIHYVSYSPDLQISTLHGIFNRFIKTYGYIIGFGPGISLINTKQEEILFVTLLTDIIFEKQIGVALLEHYSFEELTSIVREYILHIQIHCEATPPTIKRMQSILNIKKENITQQMIVKKTAKHTENLVKIQHEQEHLDIFNNLYLELQTLGKIILPKWIQIKKELSQITLNDLEIFTLEILKIKKNNSHLQNNNWDFWFLDEYQDTSPLQKDILNRLTQNSRVFIVGDPQQSIYYFRGSDVSVFLEKEKEVTQSQYSDIKYLNTNYRSCPELVAFFNDLFASDDFKTIKPMKNKYDNTKQVAQFILLDPHLKDKTQKQEVELQEIKNRIDFLLKQGTKPEEIAILNRHNKPLLLTAQYLKKQGIPVHLQTTGNFHKRREVIDALFLLRFMCNPHDDENLIGLLRTPYCRVPDKTLVYNMQTKKYDEQSLWNFLLKTTKPLPIIEKLNYHLTQNHQIGIIQSFQNAIEAFSLIDLSYYQDSTGVREANLWKLIYCLKNYTSSNSTNLSSFVDDLFYENLQLPSDQINNSQNALSAIEHSGVQLMTIHTAKGLEFKHVILTQICSGIKHTDNLKYFMSDKQTGDWTVSVKSKTEDKRIKSIFCQDIQQKEQQIEKKEFDRLLYVALTRAQQTVTLIGSGKLEKECWPMRFSFLKNLTSGTHTKKYYTYFCKIT